MTTMTTAEREERIAELDRLIGDHCEANARRYAEDELGISMACSNLRITQYQMERELLQQGGIGLFERDTLETLAGEKIEDARICNTRYGLKWRSDKLDIWAPYNPARESTLAKRGLREGIETLETANWSIDIEAPRGARGTAGLMSCYAELRPTDEVGKRIYGWRHIGAAGQGEEAAA